MEVMDEWMDGEGKKREADKLVLYCTLVSVKSLINEWMDG